MNINRFSTENSTLLSIITVCFNSATTIRDTLDSVRQQKDPRFEYIVIDGGSTDDTVGVLNANADIIDKIVSEKDNGIYDAMNKGWQLARGRYVLNLNSDDYLANDALKIIFFHLEQSGKPENYILSGVTKIIDDNKLEIVRLKLTPKLYANRYKFNPFPHPSTIISRDILLKCNGYNNLYRIASDYDMFLRASILNPTLLIIDDPISVMRSGGISDENQKISVILSHQLELYKIQSKYISKFKSTLYLVSRLTRLLMKRII
jgi:glycosyltransferase involved in cell wall biosynthesis